MMSLQTRTSSIETARRFFERCWGASISVNSLDIKHWNTYIDQRRAGTLRPPRSKLKRGVRNQISRHDLKFIMAACNWAAKVRVGSGWLLERNPFSGFEMPVEKSPNQPAITDDEYAARALRCGEAAR